MWKYIYPDTFRCALENLIGHREPYCRMEIAPVKNVSGVIDIDALFDERVHTLAGPDSFEAPELDLFNTFNTVNKNQGFDIIPRESRTTTLF